MLETAIIFLAGGVGKRFGGELPKQYTLLQNKPLFAYSLEKFLRMDFVQEIVVVAEEEYHHYFTPYLETKTFRFASPGQERQDSVYSGLQQVSETATLIAVHDGARPFFPELAFKRACQTANEQGAALLASPATDTIKKVSSQQVVTTIPRQEVYQAQTPQVIQKGLLQRAFSHVQKHNLTVTDDVSMVEAMGLPVHIVDSPATNLKITHPQDLLIAQAILSSCTTGK